MNSISATATPSLVCVAIEFNSIYCGKSLSEIQLPDKCALLGCLRNGEILSTSANPPINAGDYILAVALHSMMLSELEFALKQSCPAYYSLIDCSIDPLMNVH